MKRLAIVTTHPIQYNAPLFQLISERNKIDIRIFYTFSQSQNAAQFDSGFGRVIEWDIPLLTGYNYTFIENTSKNPGTFHFYGIVNPSLNHGIEEWKPDCILIYGWSFKSHLNCLLYFKDKIPVFFRGDSTLLNEEPGFKKIMRRTFLKWVYKHIDVAIYVGLKNKQYYLAHGLKEEQLIFGPHAVENERFSDPDNSKRKEALSHRGRLGIHESNIVFLYAGKLNSVKNINMLINTFKQLEVENARLIIVGNGQEEEDLKAIASADQRIFFLPFKNQKEMPTVYRMGDVFVLSSKSETWGLSVNEAMAAERAVIVSDKCGCAVDLIEEGKNGYIFKSNIEGDLLEKMKLMLDKEKLKEMGAYAKAYIQNWSIGKVCSQIENIVLSR